jgi:hypothetical protein
VSGNRKGTFQWKRPKATHSIGTKAQSLHFLPGKRKGVPQQVLDSADRMMKQYQADLEYLKDR